MPDQRLWRRQQLAAKIQSAEGTFDTGVLANTYATIKPFDVKLNYPVAREARAPMRASIDEVASIPGPGSFDLQFHTDLVGGGTPGTPPAFAALLKACGMSETISGSAGYSQPVADSRNAGTNANVAPVIAGTYAGTKAMRMELILNSIVTDTSASFSIYARPIDGTTGQVVTVNMTTAGPSNFVFTIAGGFTLTLALAVDPNSSTTGYNPGDTWNFEVHPSAQVAYSFIDTAHPMVSLALYQDGVVHKLHTGRGNWKITGKNGQGAKIEFMFKGSRVANGIVDLAMLTGINYDPTSPPSLLGVVGDNYGVSLDCFVNFEIDAGRNVQLVECMTDATGIEAARITGGKPTGKIDPIGVLVATNNPYTKLFNGATGTGLSLTLPGGSGYEVDIIAQLSQTSKIAQVERNGYLAEPVDLDFPSPEYDSGGNYSPLQLVFK